MEASMDWKSRYRRIDMLAGRSGSGSGRPAGMTVSGAFVRVPDNLPATPAEPGERKSR
jgi:hypothetical protein